ncbi:MAG: imidazole glycerol phosphate synthase subunit HisF [Bacteroidetes bacterium]|nr:imidazole glycerol phosphate synthase subunit HisF [Bacteroidota bacterium]
MLTKRIIPCLDIKDGRTVKGIHFENIKDAGDPVELAMRYCKEGADELVFLDISATNEKRKTLTQLVLDVAKNINIPFTVGGGVNSVYDVSILLNAGADKVSINSAAFNNPRLIKDIAQRFGNQCVVLAVDIKFENDDWFVYLNGGRLNTGKKALEWIRQSVDLGAGEILLTSMNNDGTKNGFACDITKLVSESVHVPVIASGGAGSIKHFEEVFLKGGADAALAASVFHYNEIKIGDLKKQLKIKNIEIRL